MRRLLGPGPVVGAVVVVVGGLVAGATPAAATATAALVSCDDAPLRTALAAGGSVSYGVDCTGASAVAISKPITVPSGVTASLGGGGHFVTFVTVGAARKSPFLVSGTLSVSGVTFETYTDGARGTPADGVMGGSPGAAGTDGGHGGAGRNGYGGAFNVAAGGVLHINRVLFDSTFADGGNGGSAFGGFG